MYEQDCFMLITHKADNDLLHAVDTLPQKRLSAVAFDSFVRN